MASKIAKKFCGAAFDPPFDLTADFAAMDVVRAHTCPYLGLHVNVARPPTH
jgi:hypothetical protein